MSMYSLFFDLKLQKYIAVKCDLVSHYNDFSAIVHFGLTQTVTVSAYSDYLEFVGCSAVVPDNYENVAPSDFILIHS